MGLEAGFEGQAKRATLADAKRKMAGPGSLGEGAVEQAEEALRDFEDQYDVGPVIEALSGPIVFRQGDTLHVRWVCNHPAAGYFEYGTPDDYPIEADGNVLSFVWEEPPQDAIPWLEENFEREGDGWRVFLPEVNSGEGIAETRFMRWSLRWLRWQMEAR